VEDPNGDQLEAELEFRPAAGEEWFPMADEIEETHYSFDATALPDGLYRFRLRISDEASNRGGGAQVGERVSEPIIVDHSPPRLLDTRRGNGAIEVDVEDAWNPLRRAEMSVDAGEWRALVPADGLLDGRRETLRLELPNDPGIVLLRVMDASFNAATFDLGAGAS
jgi:HAMP domain-containing protein